jgi:hypothetical protein
MRRPLFLASTAVRTTIYVDGLRFCYATVKGTA